MHKSAMLEQLYGLGYLTEAYIESEADQRRISDLVAKGIATRDTFRATYYPAKGGLRLKIRDAPYPCIWDPLDGTGDSHKVCMFIEAATFQVRCTCGTRGPYERTYELAIRLWNALVEREK